VPGLLQEIASEAAGHTGPRCSIGKALQALSESDRTDLLTALAGNYTSIQIANVLQRRKLDVGEGSVGRHRRGACRCPR
jgi:hypothetical protein